MRRAILRDGGRDQPLRGPQPALGRYSGSSGAGIRKRRVLMTATLVGWHT
ncbi:MAG: hypothetical protein QOF74_4018 [Caballeronia mineralivorans]|jgi:hypothetical protein|nr:hypothetical protein [Caballeronia mineralivorans]